MPYRDLREFLEKLEAEGELARVAAEVDWNLEVGAITRRGLDLRLSALLFEHVKGYSRNYRLLGNLFGPTRPVAQGRLALAFDLPRTTLPLDIIADFRQRVVGRVKPKVVVGGPCQENVHLGDEVDLLEFPAPLVHGSDGGRYIGTWHVDVTRDPDTGWVNWGMYRHMVHDRRTMGLLAHPSQHAGMMYQKYEERGQPMPIAVAIGTEPVCSIVAATQIPTGVDEVEVAGAVRGEPVELVKCQTVDLKVPATAEIVIEGFVAPDERRSEGPFGEYTGYQAGGVLSLPVIHVTAITHRHDPILTFSNMGKPWDEAGIISSIAVSAAIAQELERQNIPFKAVYAPPPDLGAIIAVESRPGLGRAVASAVWASKPGQHRPFLFVVGEDVDVTNLEDVYWCLVTRLHPERGIHVEVGGPGHPLFPFLSSEERQELRGIRVLFDATFPAEWPTEDRPSIVDFEHDWPVEIREKVLTRWEEYGLTYS
jgi:phenylphosphate carboxylase alpha subunit